MGRRAMASESGPPDNQIPGPLMIPPEPAGSRARRSTQHAAARLSAAGGGPGARLCALVDVSRSGVRESAAIPLRVAIPPLSLSPTRRFRPLPLLNPHPTNYLSFM